MFFIYSFNLTFKFSILNWYKYVELVNYYSAQNIIA